MDMISPDRIGTANPYEFAANPSTPKSIFPQYQQLR
jgi:hypothetical protein